MTTKKRASLAALAAVENPLDPHGRDGGVRRLSRLDGHHACAGASSGIDPLTLPGRYTSKFDLSTAGGMSAENDGTIRALGYFGKQPMISQRVVNDTAQTLAENREPLSIVGRSVTGTSPANSGPSWLPSARHCRPSTGSPAPRSGVTHRMACLRARAAHREQRDFFARLVRIASRRNSVTQ